MIISGDVIQQLKYAPNSAYESLKTEFLYHSNKIEASTFTKENLEKYLNEQIIEGSHNIDDVYETINSTKLFDFVVDTLNEPLSKRLILEFHIMLKDHTLNHERGFAGVWKKIPNMITGTNLKLAEPWEVDMKIDDLLSKWNSSNKDLESIIMFHYEFEAIHPFQDGNGRVGRFIMLKQCIEQEINLILIDDQYSEEYKKALNITQLKKDYSDLLKVVQKCQTLLDHKLTFLKETLDYINNHTIQQSM